MATPSANEVEKLYPPEDWSRDLEHWFSRGELSAGDLPRVSEYFDRVQAGNPARAENCRKLWMALAFLQSFLPDLVRAGAAPAGPPAGTPLPPSLATALYRTFMSPVVAANPRSATVPLVLQVIKEQKDWNEDRT